MYIRSNLGDDGQMGNTCYFADKWHANRHGIPVTGDTYKAHSTGFWPVNIIKLSGLLDAKSCRKDYLSGSSIYFLDRAIKYVKENKIDIVKICKEEETWKNAIKRTSSIVNYEDMITGKNPHRSAIIQSLQENAIYGAFV